MITDYFMITEKSNRLQVIMITDYDYPISALHPNIWTSSFFEFDSFFLISLDISIKVIVLLFSRLLLWKNPISNHSVLLKSLYSLTEIVYLASSPS